MDNGGNDELDSLERRLEARAQKRRCAKLRRAQSSDILERTELSADASAPTVQALIAKRGLELTEMAVCAWAAKVKGRAIIDLAHELGVTIETAKVLLKEAHDAIAEDLKANLEMNRQIDLDRVEGLLGRYYPAALEGDPEAAAVTLKCLGHRARLVGIEAQPRPNNSVEPQNVLVWIQNTLPSINKIVDALPVQ
jgi:hypothetical protein